VLLTAALPVAAWGQAAAPAAPTKVRSVLIVPYATTDLLRDEQWLGEAAAQSVMNGFRQVPGLIQVDRARLKTLPQPEMWDEAPLDALSRAIEADSQFVLAQYTRATVHQTLGNRWKASADFRASAQIDPTFPESYKGLGDLYLTAPRRLFDEAVGAYEKAIDL